MSVLSPPVFSRCHYGRTREVGEEEKQTKGVRECPYPSHLMGVLRFSFESGQRVTYVKSLNRGRKNQGPSINPFDILY